MRTKFDTLLSGNQEFIKEMASEKAKNKKDISKADKKKLLKELATDKEVRKEYAMQILPKVELNVYADTFVNQFFQMGTIDTDEPMEYVLEETVDQPVLHMNSHGGQPSRVFTRDGEVVQLYPYQITSPRVHVNKSSLMQGNLGAESQMRESVERGLVRRQEVDMWSVLEEGLVETGLQDETGLVFDDRIKNYPDSNVLDVSDVTNGQLTKQLFIEMINHFTRLGLSIQNIYIPNNRLTDIYEWVSVTSGYDTGAVDAPDTIPTSLQESIMTSGILSNMFGYNVNLVPVNTLPGTVEESDDNEVPVWVSTNQPAGHFMNVPRLSYGYSDEDTHRVYFQTVQGAVMFQPPHYKPNYAKFIIDAQE